MTVGSEFCGHRACPACMHKQRAFSGATRMQMSPKGTPKGHICKICDRKFILYETYAEYAGQIDQQDQEINDQSAVLAALQQDYTSL